MRREEAIKQFKADQQQRLQEYQLFFQKNLEIQLPVFIERFLEVFKELRIRFPENQEVAYIYFSILRCDILNKEYRVLVECMGKEWFQDPNTVSLYMPVDFLFEGIDELWDNLLEAIRPYMGKITQYEIYDMICDTVMECGRYIAGIMREVCWDIEENQDFCQITKASVWSILWGEYRGETELICHGDYEKKTRRDWDALYMQLERKPTVMATGYWYQAGLESCQCSGKDLSYTTFHECVLENMDFCNSNLYGARFLNCKIRDCRFHKADLRMAKFIDCSWENVTFDQADTTYTVFSKKGIPVEEFSEEQWEYMLLAE